MKKAIVFNKVKKSFGKLEALKGIDLTIEEGEFFALLGPNGAGKSTMFNVMTMDLKRSAGEVKVMDTEIDNLNVVEHGNKMGMCPQFNTIWKALTVDESLNFIGKVKGLSDEDIEFQKQFIKKTLDLE